MALEVDFIKLQTVKYKISTVLLEIENKKRVFRNL